MSPPVDAAGGQIQGMRRRQEDAWGVERFGDDEVLAIVADGLGGHPAGDIASRETATVFQREFIERRRRASGAPRRWLQEASFAVDRHLQQMQHLDPKLFGMASTMVALFVRGPEFWAASVGDSYLLLLRDSRLIRLNELHSEAGAVTSCLGFNLTRLDLAESLPTGSGDRFLLASDGLTTLDDDEVSGMLGSASDASGAVRELLAAIEDSAQPGQDNATTVAIFP